MSYQSALKQWVDNKYILDVRSCLRTIMLNVSNPCNFKCPMCPHSQKDYAYTEGFMSIDTAKQIKKRLDEFPYHPRVTISGMGEPCLNKDLLAICELLKAYHPQVITNGSIPIDFPSYVDVIVSVHDMAQLDTLKKRWPGAIFRNHDISDPDCELIVTNRAGAMGEKKKPTPPICACPFYKLVIDYDGHYLICADDFNRVSRNDAINVWNFGIESYYTTCSYPFKREMLVHGRRNLHPCQQCDIDGTLMGMRYVEWWKENMI